jgi:hypothetical protein
VQCTLSFEVLPEPPEAFAYDADEDLDVSVPSTGAAPSAFAVVPLVVTVAVEAGTAMPIAAAARVQRLLADAYRDAAATFLAPSLREAIRTEVPAATEAEDGAATTAAGPKFIFPEDVGFELRADIAILEARGGNAAGVAAQALKAALCEAALPSVRVALGAADGATVVDLDEARTHRVDATNAPLCLRCLVLDNGYYALDPSLEEEALVGVAAPGTAAAFMSFAIRPDGAITYCELDAPPCTAAPPPAATAADAEAPSAAPAVQCGTPGWPQADVSALVAESVALGTRLHETFMARLGHKQE